jgi:thioredoxin reductase
MKANVVDCNGLSDQRGDSFSRKKVVIIGAGGAGLAALHSMLKAGFDVELLEKSKAIGGIWHSTRYPNLTIHSKSFNYRYIDFQPLVGKGERATREEILNYMNRFVESSGGTRHIRFDTEVDSIIYDADRELRKCIVRGRNLATGVPVTIECDFVVCALGFSNGGKPHVPEFPGNDAFRGTIVHSSDFTQTMLDDARKNGKKIVIYGAGKSSHEILSVLEGFPKENLCWVYRKSLWAISFEKMYDVRHIYKFISIFAYYLFLCGLRRSFGKYNRFLYVLERPLIWGGVFLNPLEPEGNVFQNRMAIMNARQYEFLKSVRSIKSEIAGLSGNEVQLSDGQRLQADYLVCATGYERAANMPEVIVMKNGKSETYDHTSRHSFYLNMIDPALPAISLFTSNIVYSQQIFGFSIAAEWLAKFFSGTLTHGPSISEMESAIHRQQSDFSGWCSGQYLSKGGPYYFDKNNFVLAGILHELGIDRRLIRQLTLFSTDEKRFNQTCAKISASL